MKRIALPLVLIMALAAGALTGCGSSAGSSTAVSEATSTASATRVASAASTSKASGSTDPAVVTSANVISGGALGTSDLFSDRDLTQTADTSSATQVTVKSGEDVTITEEGVYVLSGTATDVTIVVNAEDSAKVQLVLDGLNVTNADEPVIFVASADKVFITTAQGSTNTFEVTGDFGTEFADNADGVIFAKDDITLNGLGTLAINSTENGIVGKDDVKVTGGTYVITAGNHGIQGKDSVRIADGTFSLTTGKDGIHAANSDDDSKGYVYICGGTFDIDAASDGIEGDYITQIDGGSFAVSAEEGIEGTFVQINGGTIDIQATDDGINASNKSTAFTPTIEINGGDISITMAQGDTDALDSNGYLYINGGTIDINAQFAFDFEYGAEMTGGTVTVNGEQVTEITESMMMGGPGGMMGGQQGGQPGQMGGQQPGGMQGGPQGGMGGQPGGRR